MNPGEKRALSSVREKLSSVSRRLQRLSKPALVEAAILFSCLAITFMIRMLPLRWGAALSEFDPYYQFYQATYIESSGWQGFADWFNLHDNAVWYPYGRDVTHTAFPGVAFAHALIYNTFTSLGVFISPLHLAVILPPIEATAAGLIIYFLGKEVGGKTTGLLSAFFLAISNGFIQRTEMGWFDDEAVSIPIMLGVYLLYLKALEQGASAKRTISYSALAGILLGYLNWSWGAARFPTALIPVLTMVIAVMGRSSRRLITAFGITMGTGLLIASFVPKLTLNYLIESTSMLSTVVFGILLLIEISRRFEDPLKKLIIPGTIVVVGVITLFGMAALGLITNPGAKFLSVIIPAVRQTNPLLISVSEQQPSTWGLFFVDNNVLVLLLPLGLYYALRRGKNADVFAVLFALTTVYFALSMVRLELLAAPALAIIGSYGLSEILYTMGKSLMKESGLRRGEEASVVQEYGVWTPILIVGLIIYLALPAQGLGGMGISPIDQANSPATIIGGSVPVSQKSPSWLNALAWIRDNTPRDAVIASWWDYGYWITEIGNRTSLIDNATFNATQIAWIADAFMSNETKAVGILRKYNASYVLVFVTHTGTNLWGYGEEGKWVQMLRIANQYSDVTGTPYNESNYFDPSTGMPNDLFWRGTLIGQLIPYKLTTMQNPSTGEYQQVYAYEPPTLGHFQLVYSSSEPYTTYAYVYIYEIVD